MMKPDAILFTSRLNLAGHEQELMGRAACLLPILGKPLLQRVMERLVELGCRQISVVLSDAAREIRAFLGEGERWGCCLSYHYLNPQERISRLMLRLGVSNTGKYWLAEATRLPIQGDEGILCSNAAWSGWATVPGNWLLSQDDIPAVLPMLLQSERKFVRKDQLHVLKITDSKSFLASCFSLLAGKQIGKNGDIHPSVQLIEPVYIGPQVKIAAGCVIGPNVVIEQGCFIDCNVNINHSVILSHSYIGQNLALSHNLIQGRWMANTALDCCYTLNDTQLLSDLQEPFLNQKNKQAILAYILRLALFPLYQIAKRHIATQEIPSEIFPCPKNQGASQISLQLPATQDNCLLSHFCYSFYPGLKAVCRGQLSLLGPQLRARAIVEKLPKEWRELYTRHQAGLLNDALFIQHPNSDELFASDIIAAATQFEQIATWQILKRYLSQILQQLKLQIPTPQTSKVLGE